MTSVIISDNGSPPPNAATPSPSKEIRAAYRKGNDLTVRQAGRSPACAVIGREKNAAFSPCEEIRATHRKSGNICFRQAVIDRSPACAVVGREKNAAATSPCKEIRAARRKGGNIYLRQAFIDRSPVSADSVRGIPGGAARDHCGVTPQRLIHVPRSMLQSLPKKPASITPAAPSVSMAARKATRSGIAEWAG